MCAFEILTDMTIPLVAGITAAVVLLLVGALAVYFLYR